MNRAERYYEEIRAICSDHRRCRGLTIRGTTLRVTLSPECGPVYVWFDFFADSVIAFARHRRSVAPEYHTIAKAWLNEYNLYHGSNAYGVNRQCELTFFAGYDLRYRSPENDPGLDGFCRLLLETVPDRLNRITELLDGIADKDNRPETAHKYHQ